MYVFIFFSLFFSFVWFFFSKKKNKVRVCVCALNIWVPEMHRAHTNRRKTQFNHFVVKFCTLSIYIDHLCYIFLCVVLFISFWSAFLSCVCFFFALSKKKLKLKSRRLKKEQQQVNEWKGHKKTEFVTRNISEIESVKIGRAIRTERSASVKAPNKTVISTDKKKENKT